MLMSHFVTQVINDVLNLVTPPEWLAETDTSSGAVPRDIASAASANTARCAPGMRGSAGLAGASG